MEDHLDCVKRAADPALPHETRSRAFAVLASRFQDMAFAYALGLLGDPHQAEDAAQEGFIASWQNLASLKEPAAFPGWFRQIVRWQCNRFRRVQKPAHTPFDPEIHGESADPLGELEKQDRNQAIQKTIQALPETLRSVTMLHYVSDYSQPEIAQFLDLRPGTVKKRLFDARRKLKSSLRHLADTLPQHAPSKNPTFGGQIMKWVRPDSLTEKYRPFSGGKGTDVWNMLLAAAENDLKTAKELLQADPKLAQCKFAYYTPLHFAAREGHIEMVQLLLKHSANPTETSSLSYQTTPLARAQDRGLDPIITLLETAIEDQFQATPVGQDICNATRESDMDRVITLLNQQPDLVNASDERGNRPLHIAVETNQRTFVDLLLDKGANLEAVRGDGFKPLHCAIYRNRRWKGRPNPLLTGYLIARGVNYSITAAAALGDEHRVNELLASDANQASDQDTCKYAPLSSAAGAGFIGIVRTLLEHGADPNASERDAPQGAALYKAVANDDLEMVTLLLEHGANSNAEVESSGNPLTQALGRKNQEMAELLYTRGATAGISQYILLGETSTVAELLKIDPGLANSGGDYGALCMAAGFAPIEIIQLLIRAGADLNRPWYANNYMGYAFNRRNRWELDGSKMKPHTDQIDVLKLFLESGADPNLANWHGVTYLHKLAENGDIEKAEVLLQYGADIHAIDDEWGSTPLGWAARMDQKEMVAFLLNQGADLNLASEPWASPVARAEKAGHPEIVDLLRDNGAIDTPSP